MAFSKDAFNPQSLGVQRQIGGNDINAAVETQFGDKAKSYKRDKEAMDSIVSPYNQGFRNTAEQYGNLINSNTGANGYNKSFSQGMNDGTQMYKAAYGNAKGDARSLADEVSQMQAGKANSAAMQNARPMVGKGAAALMASKAGADVYANTYGNNFNNQFGNLMNANLTSMNNQQNMYGQQLANQINTTGTLMGANLTNDQAEYQQQITNAEKGVAANLGKESRSGNGNGNGNGTSGSRGPSSPVQKPEGNGGNSTPTVSGGNSTTPNKGGEDTSTYSTPGTTVNYPGNGSSPTVTKGTSDVPSSASTPYKGPSNIPINQNISLSDARLKNSVRLRDDPRMSHFNSCGDKIRCLNPNKWEELKWRMR